MSTYSARSIRDYSDEIHAWAQKKGWLKPALCSKRGCTTIGQRHLGSELVHVEPKVSSKQIHLILAKLALIVEEVGEAVTEARHARWGIYRVTLGKHMPYKATGAGEMPKPEGFVVEIADIMIRCMQLCAALGLPLQEALELKLKYNHTRPYRHGKKA